MPGPGVLRKNAALEQALESKPSVQGPRQEILKQYGFDLLKQGLLNEFYSPTLNLVATIDELYVRPPPGLQAERYGHFPFKCVGAQVDLGIKRVQHAEVRAESDDSLLTVIDEAIGNGRKLVYLSMGTVATGKFWNSSFGSTGCATGLENCTGKSIFQHVLKMCFKGLGENESIAVVVATGPKDDVLDGVPSVPSNFVLRKTVPQLEVLKRSNVFITHGGANSMHEALSLGVPMAVLPLFGDQHMNAKSIERCGVGLAFSQPLSMTCAAMSSAIEQLLQSKEQNSFLQAAAIMSEKLKASGGIPAAADAIIESAISVDKQKVRSTDGHGRVRTMIQEIEGNVALNKSIGKRSINGARVSSIRSEDARTFGNIGKAQKSQEALESTEKVERLRRSTRLDFKPREASDRSGRWSGIMSAPTPGLLQPSNGSPLLRNPSCSQLEGAPHRNPSSQPPNCLIASATHFWPAISSGPRVPAGRLKHGALAPQLGHSHKCTKHPIVPNHLSSTCHQAAAQSFQAPHFGACAA
jgi:hypothetical protein